MHQGEILGRSSRAGRGLRRSCRRRGWTRRQPGLARVRRGLAYGVRRS